MSRSSWGSKSRTDRPNVWRLRYWRDTPDGRKRVTEMFRGTRREADDRLAELRLQYGKTYGGSLTVAQVYERLWLPDAAERVRAATLTNYASVWRCCVSPRWAGVPCDQVRPLDVQAWLTGGAMSHNRAKVALQILRGVLDVAVMYELADHNAAAGKFRLPTEAAHMSHDILHGDDELRAYADAVAGTVAEAPYLLMCAGGCRVGESLSVAVGDVHRLDVDGVLLAATHITRSIDNHGNVAPLKTAQSDRTVALSGEWAERLLAVQDAAAAEGWRWLADDGFGAVVSQETVRRVWYAAIDAAGLPRRLMRNLRPTFATAMFWQGEVPLDKLRTMMGHKAGSAVTLEHYDRPADDDVLHARAAAELGHFRTQS